MAVVEQGRYNIATELAADFDEIAIGSDGTAIADSDTDVRTEVDRATGLSGTSSNNVASLTNTFSFSSSQTIAEAGLFFTGGSVVALQSFGDINVSSGDSLQVDFDLTNNEA